MCPELKQVCYVGSKTKRVMRGLAWALLALYAFTFGLLILFSCLCWNKYNHGQLFAYWKFFLHMWCKLQMVAFFYVLALTQSCCIKAFLFELYKISVSWDHKLRLWIDNTLRGGRDYDEGMSRNLPEQFNDLSIKPYILHNMLIFFMVQLLIAVIYFFFKVWDFMNFYKKSFMFRIFNFVEYTLLIVGYVIIIMQIAVFTSLEVRGQRWSHSYFVCCFVICVLYWLVFALFWLYSISRILGPEHFWIGNNNGNKYFFFFAGMRDFRFARTYDHWFFLAHMVVGLMIGFLRWNAIA